MTTSFHGKWIDIWEAEASTKTKRFMVTVAGTRDEVLGEIRFFPRWRKYSFFPQTGSLYEADCLRDIASFCETETVGWRMSKRIEAGAAR